MDEPQPLERRTRIWYARALSVVKALSPRTRFHEGGGEPGVRRTLPHHRLSEPSARKCACQARRRGGWGKIGRAVPQRTRVSHHVCLGAAGLLLGSLLPSWAAAGGVPDPAARLDQAIAAAEAGLRENEVQTAESRYRSALLEGWLVMGTLDAVEGRLPEAREAFRNASISAVENKLALH